MKHLNIRITGRVQGVFFRAWTQKKAREIGIRGFVRNEPDGSVYAEAEAEESQLDEFLACLKKGPPGARVEQVASDEAPARGYTGFEVRH